MPGLSRLWCPYHTAQPSGHATAADLLARLSRALIDPSYADDHGWVEKGRTLFAAATPRLGDAAVSREIGGLLGNDIGQMRLQFNPRTYVIEPAYRDDNMGLWDFRDQNGDLVEEIDIGAESARVEQKQGDEGKPDNQIDPDSPRARPQKSVASDGILIAHYPEWDYDLARARPNWVTVRESEPDLRAPIGMAATPEADTVARRVTAIARGAAIGRRIREKCQIEGEMLDIDASIAAMIERRSKQPPDIRVFQREIPGPRELSLLLLLDLSQSTADKGRDGRSVIAVERDAATILGAAFDAAADSLAIHGFNSDTREKVRYVKFKDFDEPMDAVVAARLRAMASAHSTRLGAAVRHAGTYLQRRRSFRRVLLVLTDGEPSDIDVQDPRYLVEDARQAVLALRRTGIDVLAFGLGQGSFDALDRIVGHKRSLRVPRIDALPERVMQLYAQLKT
jgi:nitric oxide reductase activation protein